MTAIEFDAPALTEFAKASADAGSVYKGLEHMAGLGLLGQVAKEIAELAGKAYDSGYVPPAKRDKYEYHARLAKSAGLDRELAAYHRERANEARRQLGEEGR